MVGCDGSECHDDPCDTQPFALKCHILSFIAFERSIESALGSPIDSCELPCADTESEWTYQGGHK
jgi:hypothetical protein